MHIEKWEAGCTVQRVCPKITELLFMEGEAKEGKQGFSRTSEYALQQ